MDRRSLALPARRWYRRGRLWVASATGAGVAFVVGIVVLLPDVHVITSASPVPKYIGSVGTAQSLLSVTATLTALTALVLRLLDLSHSTDSCNERGFHDAEVRATADTADALGVGGGTAHRTP